ncbi:hypothetical protein Btru_002525 [Bulinus truncatus]|nr:hypothetical protein Btru_002525 [Bulinus truncatus]
MIVNKNALNCFKFFIFEKPVSKVRVSQFSLYTKHCDNQLLAFEKRYALHKRYIRTGNTVENDKKQIPAKYKVILVSSGLLAAGYYVIHTATHSLRPAKP